MTIPDVERWPELATRLAEARAAGATFPLPVVERIVGAHAVVDGRELLTFCTNDYLGLGQHPEVRRAAAETAERYGWSTAAARGLTGNSPWHRDLEAALADFLGVEDAACFTGGYLGNLGLIPTLAGPGSTIAVDEGCHASMLDACRLSGAAWTATPHGDVAAMERALAGRGAAAGAGEEGEAGGKGGSDLPSPRPSPAAAGEGDGAGGAAGAQGSAGNPPPRTSPAATGEGDRAGATRAAAGADRWLITDGGFAGGGDRGPLREAAAAARRTGARLIVDDAHGFGVYGALGRGMAEHAGLQAEVDVRVGTLSKAGGSVGGFVAGAHTLIETLRQRSKPYLFTAGLPPAVCAAGLAALRVLAREPERRRRLWEITRAAHDRLRALGFDLGATSGPLTVLWFGDADRARAAAAQLDAHAIHAFPMLPPFVPAGKARIRLALTLHHTPADLERLYAALAGCVR
ncbi:MAG: aminotransferase class I/II-fold pyridoxal phosphate-dependent enzyme [Planctomycetes bacterium]|nr:aminotransferase class I/II-fold pyridoxal phosphate-dependent enzyme [Planctomycetota bacterium]